MKLLSNCIFAALLFFAHNAIGVEPPKAQAGPVNTVSVSIRVSSIDSIDVTKGTYSANIYLGLTCQEICPKFSLNFFHGEINKPTFVMKEISPYQTVFHIQLKIEKDFYSILYPFDSYWLNISFIDQDNDSSKLLFKTDMKHSVIAPNVILHGWELVPGKKVFIDTFNLPFLNTSFSRYNFAILIKRPVLMGFLKIIFPAVIILLFAFITFIIATRHSIQRLGIVSGTLISSILLHLSISNSLPLLSYLTYVDSFMIINYLIFFIILIENVYVMRLIDEGQEEHATKFDKTSLLTIPILWLVLEIFCVLFFIYTYPVQ